MQVCVLTKFYLFEFFDVEWFFFIFTGNNILYVGMYGPTKPCEEVFIKHTGRNTYNVNYLIRERGDYILIVKWGDDHIPGSPYKVEA